MTMWLWLAILGWLSMLAGVLGHVYSTRLVETKVEKKLHVVYYDMSKGWIKTIVDRDGDAEEFWSSHKIVEREK